MKLSEITVDKNFPKLSPEEKLFLQGIVHDSLEVGHQPSTEQQRIIAKLMRMRLLVKGKDKVEPVNKLRLTPWGMNLVKTDSFQQYAGGNTEQR